MSDQLLSYILLAIALYIPARMLLEVWRAHRTSRWPKTTAKLILISEESDLERTRSKWNWSWGESDESDFALSYVVNDKDYLVQIEPLVSFSISGRNTSQHSGLPETFELRYQGDDPKRIYYHHAYSYKAKAAVLAFELVIAGVFLTAFLSLWSN